MRRITVLETKKLFGTEKIAAYRNDINERLAVINDEYVARFQARTVTLLPTILKNAQVFGRAVAEIVGQQWASDQIGILLAGAYSLYHHGEVEWATALEFVKKQDWSEERGLEHQTDQMRLISKIAEQTIRISIGQDRTVGELILRAADVTPHDSYVSTDDANATLKRLGISVAERDGKDYTKGMVLISNSADWLKKILDGSTWQANHGKILKRIDGAMEVESYRFAGLKSRAVALPIDIFTD